MLQLHRPGHQHQTSVLVLTMKIFVKMSWMVFSSAIFMAFASKSQSDEYAERLEMHLNANFFLTGESLLFSVHCLNAKGPEWSGLSTVAYIELIDETGMPALRTKVGLKNGLGAGDLFLN